MTMKERLWNALNAECERQNDLGRGRCIEPQDIAVILKDFFADQPVPDEAICKNCKWFYGFDKPGPYPCEVPQTDTGCYHTPINENDTCERFKEKTIPTPPAAEGEKLSSHRLGELLEEK